MFKLFRKKLNKKGFTLAELLVVIAILAILIAIAIPVFSKMVAEANLRVNQANVHSTRSAAVASILTNLDKEDDNSVVINQGLGKDGTTHGWIALAYVDNAGNINDLKIYVVTDTTQWHDGIYIGAKEDLPTPIATDGTGSADGTFFLMPDDIDTTKPFATVKPTTTSGDEKVYTTQAVITDLDLELPHS